MRLTRSDFADLAYFRVVARQLNFRVAAEEIGISTSALSHAIKGLETRLDVRLLNRTNRNVSLTAAGIELHLRLGDAFDTIGDAVDALNGYREGQRGRVRISVPTDAATLLIEPILPDFARRHPDIEIEVTVDDHFVDLPLGGFDAGIRYGGSVPEDMVTQRLTPDLRWVLAGSPAYIEEMGHPATPQDLMRHRCIRIRLGNDRIYRWELERAGEVVELDVPGSITVNSAELGMRMAAGGAGLFYCLEKRIAPDLQSGTLEIILPDWSPLGPGFFIYYPGRRQVPSGLRLLIEAIRQAKPLG